MVGRSRRVGSSPAGRRWGTDDGGYQTLEGGGAEYALWTERRKKDERREGAGKMLRRTRRPDEYRRGGEGRNRKHLGRETYNLKNRNRV